MIFPASRRSITTVAALLVGPLALSAAQQPGGADHPAPPFAGVDSLNLPNATAKALTQDLARHDYLSAEKILLPEIQPDDKSDRMARMLSFMGGIYYLDHDYLHAAVAWKKSQAIEPLEPSVQFSLAMSYIELARPEWARGVLQQLAQHDPKNALYPYWLGRLDYDAREYSRAIVHFLQAIVIDPGMARAHDNLGLCYYHQNENQLAVESFRRAIDLQANEVHPSAWPWFNLAVTLQLLNRSSEAEADLRRAIRLDPQFAQAYYELGNVLQQEGRRVEAVTAWEDAARTGPDYAEPHLALARAYREKGDTSLAQQELKTFLRLRQGSAAAGETLLHP